MTNWKKRIAVGGVVILGLLGLAFALWQWWDKESNGKGTSQAAPKIVKGRLLPKRRAWVYAEVDGRVEGFDVAVRPGSKVAKDQDLVRLYDEKLAKKITTLQADIAAADLRLQTVKAELL